jgi:pimeloyl-ACP methyl ester carboxylesterase
MALARAFARHGQRLELPNLNAPSFQALTMTDMLDALDRLDADGDAEWRLVGSSLGGYVAALWAQYNGLRVDRLVLLAPGFGLQDHWDRLVGPGGVDRWKIAGDMEFADAAGTPTPVHWELVEDLEMYPRIPEVPCPTLILHGTGDEVVPIESSREYARTHPKVRLVELPDDHLLHDSIFRVEAEIMKFFKLV